MEHTQQVTGMNADEVKALIESLDREFAPKGKANAKPPAGPPPKHVLNKKGGQQGGPAPSTPPLGGPKKSALNRRDGPTRFQQNKVPRITWPQNSNVRQVKVESYRH